MTTIITGSTGRLGEDVAKVFKGALCPKREEFDLTNANQIEQYVSKHKPELFIHLAALVPIRDCENDKAKAWNTNVEGTRLILNNLNKYAKNCYFVYISSPCIFSGDQGGYDEDSIPYPHSFYGITKLVSEQIIIQSGLKYLITRTNFVPKKKWLYPKAFTDRFGTYLFADDVANGLKQMIEANEQGIRHLVGNKKISMYELAIKTTPNVLPMTLKEYDGPQLTVDMSMTTKYEKWNRFQISDSAEKFY